LTGSDATQTTTSDPSGAYRFLNLPPGTYRLAAALTGFSSVSRQNAVVAVGSTVEIPLNMKVAAVAETIEVTAESPVVDTKKIGTATNFSQDELANAVIAADLSNVTNSNVELNRQRNIGSTAFNQLTSNLSPRILRLGLRLTF
jgi:Carboxypeptidase regulatory-like domain